MGKTGEHHTALDRLRVGHALWRDLSMGPLKGYRQ